MNNDQTNSNQRRETPGAFFDRVLIVGKAERVFSELRRIRLEAERDLGGTGERSEPSRTDHAKRDGAPVPAIASAQGWDGRA